MAGELQPLDEKFPIVGEDGRPTLYFIKWAQQRQIDINEATTAEQVEELIIAYFLAHPITIDWGDIDGTLSDQTDLQAALDAKLTVVDNAINWSPGALRIADGIPAFSVGDTSVQASITFYPGPPGNPTSGGWELDLPGYVGGIWFGDVSAGNRMRFNRYGTITGFEFGADPYVNNNVIWHAGNFDPDSKLTVFDDSANWGPNTVFTDKIVFSVGDAAVSGSVSLRTNPDPTKIPQVFLSSQNFVDGVVFGGINAHSRAAFIHFGPLTTGYEFDEDIYVGTDKVYHEGNLSFGTGLDYTAGVLTTTGSAGILPVVDGSIPPVFLQNPDGSLIYAPI